ncbi:tetratricopeptide repeat protein [Virgibacillus kimchii]
MPQLKDKETKQNKVIPFIPEGDFYFTKGVEAFKKRKFDIALKWLKKATEQNPNDPLYQCQMSIIYTEIGSYHEANELLRQVLDVSDYNDCYYLLANNYAHLGLLHEAKKYVLTYLEKEPDGDFTEDANTLLKLIDFDEEEEEDLDLEDEDELLIYQETCFYHMENLEWDKALPLLEDMQLLFPEYSSAFHDYTQALFYTGSREEALQLEIGLLEDHPNNMNSHINLALFYNELDQKEARDSHISHLYNVYPFHEQQKLKVATVFSKVGLYEEAYNRFRRLNKSRLIGHLSYYRWYSKAAFQIGYPSKAHQIWKEGCKKHPKLGDEEVPW